MPSYHLRSRFLVRGSGEQQHQRLPSDDSSSKGGELLATAMVAATRSATPSPSSSSSLFSAASREQEEEMTTPPAYEILSSSHHGSGSGGNSRDVCIMVQPPPMHHPQRHITSSSTEVNAAVADAWLQMGKQHEQEQKHPPIVNKENHPKLIATGAASTTNIFRRSIHGGGGLDSDKKKKNNNAYSSSNSSSLRQGLTDWWTTPCSTAGSNLLMEPKTSVWSRQNRSQASIRDQVAIRPPPGFARPLIRTAAPKPQPRTNNSLGAQSRQEYTTHNAYREATTCASAWQQGQHIHQNNYSNKLAVSSSSSSSSSAASLLRRNRIQSLIGGCGVSGSFPKYRGSNNSSNTTRLASLFDSPSDNPRQYTSVSSSIQPGEKQGSFSLLNSRRQQVDSGEAASWKQKYYIHSSSASNIMTKKEKKDKDKSLSKTENKTGECKWRTAVDAKSGKTYYYHVETRETQWRKPLELASPAERQVMQEKEARQRDFFAAMEANILRNLQTGGLASTTPVVDSKKKASPQTEREQQQEWSSSDDDSDDSSSSNDDLKRRQQLDRPNLVRTISSMDERILRDLVLRVPSHRMSTTETTTTTASPNDVTSAGIPNTIDDENKSLDLLPEEGKEPRTLGRAKRSASSFNPLRFSTTRDKSLTNVLATLPEAEPSLSVMDFDFDFGEQSFSGLDETESQALIRFAQMSSQMALVGENDDSFLLQGEGSLTETSNSFFPETVLEKGDEEDESEHVDEQKPVVEEDPLAKMDLDPLRTAANRMRQGRASQHLQPSQLLERPKASRRNTCGTLYVGSTLSAPDIDATIQCVCGVVRAHILQSEMEERPLHPNSKYVLFNDLESQQQRRGSSGVQTNMPAAASKDFHQTPSLDQMCAFYRDVFTRAQMESDCIIMSLIYVERLIKCTRGKLRPRAANWRSVLFSSMVLASKVWDDLSMWNGDFSQTCPAGVNFCLQRINQLELAVLEVLSYKVKVPASEYAKYYFLLRAMLIKSGLGGDALVREMNPLDVEGARRLQAVSSKYQRAANLRLVGNRTGPRSKSLNIELDQQPLGSGPTETAVTLRNGGGKVSLEHMVQM